LTVIFKKLKSYASLTILFFSIPILLFGFISILFAHGSIPPASVLVWIFVALLATRLGGNAFNRIADRDFDKKNPRTKDRDIPAGRVKLFEAYILTILFFALLLVAAYNLNTLCLILSPLAIGLSILYSYTKRFTWLCHFVLGFVFGGAPVGVWIAITGSIDVLPFVLGCAIMFFVAAADIINSIQDRQFDSENKLHSIPAKFGQKKALFTAVFSQVIFFAMLAVLPYFAENLSWFYYIGLAVILLLLIVEHILIDPANEKKMIFIVFGVNNIIIIILFTFVCIDYFIL